MDILPKNGDRTRFMLNICQYRGRTGGGIVHPEVWEELVHPEVWEELVRPEV